MIQNMYNIYVGRKWTVLQGKLIFYTTREAFWVFRADKIWVVSLWRELEAKPLTSSQLLGHPWKVWDIILQMSYVEAWWATIGIKIEFIAGRYFVGGLRGVGEVDADISESLSFLSNDLKPQISKLTFLRGQHPRIFHARICIGKVCTIFFGPSYSRRKSEEGGQTFSFTWCYPKYAIPSQKIE